LHDAVREIMDENLRVQDAERHRELHERAAAYFEKRLEKATGEEAERLGLERLYHRIRADEETGIQLFQEMVEELVRSRLVNRLRALLNDVNTYPLERENSRLWREYYNARLTHLQARWLEAMPIYQRIGENALAAPKLRAYALCDYGSVLCSREIRHQPGVLEKALRISELSIAIAPQLDDKLILNYDTQSNVYMNLGEWEKAFAALEHKLDFYQELKDEYGKAHAYNSIKLLSAVLGDWPRMYKARKQGLASLPKVYERSFIYGDLIAGWSPAYAWSGRYHEAETYTREALNLAIERGEVDVFGLLRDLGLVLALQDKFAEAAQYISECEQRQVDSGMAEIEMSTTRRWKGCFLMRAGQIEYAAQIFDRLIILLRQAAYTAAMGETIAWCGLAYEINSNLNEASKRYMDSLSFRGRRYFECLSLTGLIRVKHAQGDYAAIPPLLADAEQLAQQYEYNDHLASLRLTQGHIAWEGNAPAWENGFDAALRYYQHALIYALRYNRFLLDEVLSGRPQGTPLRPIIPECLKRGEEGRRMLIALRDWWQMGTNDIGTPRPDTISPIPEGIPLLEAERIARQREPGDGSPQKSVVEQIEAALKNVEAG